MDVSPPFEAYDVNDRRGTVRMIGARDRNGARKAACRVVSDQRSPADAEELRALIVSACNGHAELLGALKALDAAMCDGFDTQAQRMAGRRALITARAAIAKAEGRAP